MVVYLCPPTYHEFGGQKSNIVAGVARARRDEQVADTRRLEEVILFFYYCTLLSLFMTICDIFAFFCHDAFELHDRGFS